MSLVLNFSITCEAVSSPHRLLSWTQPRYGTVWYCLICIVPYLTSRFLPFFYLFFVSNSILLVLLSLKWMLRLLLTNQLQTMERFLFSFCSITLIFMYWYIKQESSAYGKNQNQQLGTCHLHITETIKALKKSLWYSTVDFRNIGVFIFGTDLNSYIRKVILKPGNRLNWKSKKNHLFQ